MPYGVSTSPLSPRRIPILVYECVRFIKQRDGMNASGVFRVNGSEKRMKDLLNVFDTGPRYGLGFSFDGYSVFDVAAYLKK